MWFDDGNIFHIDQQEFGMVFQQHRNVNRHINWLTDEISLINHQIKLIKDQLVFSTHNREQRINFPEENNDIINPIPLSLKNNSEKFSSPITELKNHENTYILKLLSNESLFDGYLEDLIDIYELSVTATIECIAVVREQNSIEKYFFIKLSDGNIDKYQINRTKILKTTISKTNQPILIWNNDGKQPEYYRRFIQDNQKNQVMITDQFLEIKNRPKQNDARFFDMMGQILRIKYHIDPSSLSCILEDFFSNIYTCDGRLIYPHELKFLSIDNNLFVFYAVMMDTLTEKQIYPLDTNNHIRYGDQIFFLFQNHPQFNSLSSLTCPDCPQTDQTYMLSNNNNNEKEIQSNTDNQIIESTISTDNIVKDSSFTIPQNHIVYVLVASISLYILIGIYISRKHESTEYLSKRHSISSSRRGR